MKIKGGGCVGLCKNFDYDKDKENFDYDKDKENFDIHLQQLKKNTDPNSSKITIPLNKIDYKNFYINIEKTRLILDDGLVNTYFLNFNNMDKHENLNIYLIYGDVDIVLVGSITKPLQDIITIVDDPDVSNYILTRIVVDTLTTPINDIDLLTNYLFNIDVKLYCKKEH